MLRVVAVLSIFLFSAIAHAGCSPTMSGESIKRAISISDCDHPVMMISINDFSHTTDGGVQREPVPFVTQCKMSAAGFSCHSQGKTPLVGSTYRYTHDTNPSCEGRREGIRLTCVAGCTTEAPKYFYITPFEC